VIIDEIRGLHREMTFDAGWRARIESDIQDDKSQDRHQIDPKTNSGKDPQEGKFITFSGPGNCDRSLTIDSPSLLRNVFFRNLA